MADEQPFDTKRKKKIDTKKIAIRAAIVLTLVALVAVPILSRRKDSLLAVNSTVVKRGDVEEFLSLEARLVPKEIQKVMASGQTVLQVHVEEGDEVTRGQLLLTLDMSELEKTLEERKQAIEDQKKLIRDIDSLMATLKRAGSSLNLGQVSRLTGNASELFSRLNNLVASWQKITDGLLTMDAMLVQDSLERINSILRNGDELMEEAVKFVRDTEKEIENLKGVIAGLKDETTLHLLEIQRNQLLWMRSMLVNSETALVMADDYLTQLMKDFSEKNADPSLIESIATLSKQLKTILSETRQLTARIDRLLKEIDALIEEIENTMKQLRPTAVPPDSKPPATISGESTPTTIVTAVPTAEVTSTKPTAIPSHPKTVAASEPTGDAASNEPSTESSPSTSNVKVGRARLQVGGIDSMLFSQGSDADILSLLTGQYGQLAGLFDHSVDAAEKALADAKPEVRAEFDGTIVHLNVKKGDQPSPLSMQTPLMEVYKRGDFEAVFQANENDAHRLSKGDKVNYLFAGMAFQGQVIYKAPIAESANDLFDQSSFNFGGILGSVGGMSPTVAVRMSIEGDGIDKLTPGFNIRADIEIGHKKDVLTVPVESLLRDRGRDCVVRLEDDVATIVPVTIGLQSATVVEIISGLEVDDVIAVNPNPDIKDGSRITVKTHKP